MTGTGSSNAYYSLHVSVIIHRRVFISDTILVKCFPLHPFLEGIHRRRKKGGGGGGETPQ